MPQGGTDSSAQEPDDLFPDKGVGQALTDDRIVLASEHTGQLDQPVGSAPTTSAYERRLVSQHHPGWPPAAVQVADQLLGGDPHPGQEHLVEVRRPVRLD